MFKIIIFDTLTNSTITRYGLRRSMMEDIYYYHNEVNPDFTHRYEIQWLFKLCFSFEVLKKCIEKETIFSKKP